MSAFAAAVGALFADPNMGHDAVYIADGGAPVLVRVVARPADAVTDFGDARLWSETTRIDLRARVLAGGAIGVIRATMRYWFDHNGRPDLAELGARAIDHLESGFIR